MTARFRFPGFRSSRWLRNAALRSGVLAGIYLSCIFIAWLVVANRVRELEPYAELRNLIAAVLFAAVLVIAPLRFRNQPGRLFKAGLTAWTLLTATYVVAETHFTLLQGRMGALHLFAVGAVSYGFVAVLDWVFLICAEARHQYMLQQQSNAIPAGKPRTP